MDASYRRFFLTKLATQCESASETTRCLKASSASVASQVGLRVPQTLITSDPDEAIAFVAGGRGAVVHKAMTAPPHQFIDTRAWDAAASRHVAELALCPTILQERVFGPADVPTTIVGDQISPLAF